MKKPLFALLPGVASALVLAAPGDHLTELYFSDKNPTLTQQEKAAIAIAEKWKNPRAKGVAPVTGPNGSIKFLYGAQQPSIVCAVLQVCDVALQAGEQVNSINLGDTARWTVEPAVTGSGAGEVQHLIIKPLDVGLETSMVVTTNRRSYHLRLRSHRSQYMPQVAFTYPEEAMAKWEAIKAREGRDRDDRTLPETREYMGNLSFDYEVSGSAAWKPVRVYNDGRKTVIQMPSTMAQTEAPALLVVRKDGGVFTDDETVMVNYRVQGNRYIVDSRIRQGHPDCRRRIGQDRVTIQKGQ
jgi:P-type conjugative transfer protein TrbG